LGLSRQQAEAVLGAQADLEPGLDAHYDIRAGPQCGFATGLSRYFASGVALFLVLLYNLQSFGAG